MSKTVAIDIGVKGGLSMNINGDIFTKPLPYDDGELVISTLCTYLNNADVVAIEQPYIPGGMANKGTQKAITDYGQILGIAKMHSDHVYSVHPRKWKSHMGLSKDKQESIDMAEKLYPGINLLRTERSRKKCDGMAESLLILHYIERYLEAESTDCLSHA